MRDFDSSRLWILTDFTQVAWLARVLDCQLPVKSFAGHVSKASMCLVYCLFDVEDLVTCQA